MNFKVNSSTRVKKSEKKSKTKASKAEGLGFASALQQAQKTEVTDSVDSVAVVDSIQPVFVDSGSGTNHVPENAKERGYYILNLLEELEKDILSGSDTKVMQKLEDAMQNPALDLEEMPQVVKDLMIEIDTRAALELEKLKIVTKK